MESNESCDEFMTLIVMVLIDVYSKAFDPMDSKFEQLSKRTVWRLEH
jgi:hypothetical protein